MLTYAKETIRHKAEAHTLGMEKNPKNPSIFVVRFFLNFPELFTVIVEGKKKTKYTTLRE